MSPKATFLMAGALALASCTSQAGEPAQTDNDGATPAEAEPTAQPLSRAGADAAAVDVAAIDVCELVPAELVATTVGGAVFKPATRSDYGTSQGCEYGLDPSGPDTYEYGAIWLGPPSDYGDPQDRMEVDRGLGQEVTSEPLEGLGDEAYVIHNATEEQSTVYVLLSGRVSISATAEHFEDARRMAELTLSRL